MMDDSLTVYWSDEMDSGAVTPTLLIPPTERALKEMDLPDFKSFPSSGIQRCPAFISYYQNAFLYRSPIDITISHESGRYEWKTSLSDQKAIDSLVDVRDDSGMLTLSMFCFFFCEEAVMVEQLHPFFLPGEVASKCETICGSFDISQWFRPLQPAFRFRERGAADEIVIRRGDPLFLIRFVTSRRVKFKQFNACPDLHRLSHQISEVKTSTYDFHKSLTNYYEVFKLRRLHKRIGKLIQENLVDP